MLSSSKSSLKESSRALVVRKNDDDFAFFLGKAFFKGPLLCRLFRVCVKKEAEFDDFFIFSCICVYPHNTLLFDYISCF